MNIIVFRHQQSVGLGSMASRLDKSGAKWRYVDLFAEGVADFDPYGPDILIVLGGTPGAYQTDVYPFIADEIRILQKRLEKDMPTLGICLGAQMMAAALGAAVYPGKPGAERGWSPLTLTEEGRKTPLRHLDSRHTNMFHWHGDSFDLPQGTTLLASSALYQNQAFSWGEHGLALQFHPEMTPASLEEWLISKAGDAARNAINPAVLRTEMKQHGARLMNQTDRFFEEWLEQAAAAL